MATSEKPTGVLHEEDATAEQLRHGDEALAVLTTDTDPIGDEEARKVRRKIDWRLLPAMMVINALQLVDKNVSFGSQVGFAYLYTED